MLRVFYIAILIFITHSISAQIHEQHCFRGQHKHNLNAQRNSRVALNYNLIYGKLIFELDPNIRKIKGIVNWYFNSEANTSFIEFDFSEVLKVDSIYFHGLKLNSFERTGDVLRVNLPQSLDVVDSITIAYSGVPVDVGESVFVKQWHGQGNVIWTLSEPYGSSDWMPCKEVLSDKIDSLDITVKVPKGNIGVSNGKRISVVNNATHSSFYYKHRSPIAHYLIAISASNYKHIKDTINVGELKMPINSYLYPQTGQKVIDNIKNNTRAIQLYSELFGEYPFKYEQYGHCQFSRNGGMEHQTISFEGYFGEDLLAHELAHQWFGDYVTCGSWKDIWLNEGFATYLEMLLIERFYPIAEQRKWREETIKYVCSEKQGSVYCEDTSKVSRIFDYRLTYNKSAMVLHMLRKMLGDDSFYNAINEYLNKYKNDVAFTESIKSTFKKHTTKDIDSFFNLWIYGEGYTTFTVNYTQDTILGIIRGEVSQLWCDSSKKYFSDSVEIIFKTNTGDIKYTHFCKNQSDSFAISGITNKVKDVLIDADFHILSSGNMVNPPIKKFKDFSAHIYPNPAIGAIFLDYYYLVDAINKIEVFDEVGKLIKEMSFESKIPFYAYPILEAEQKPGNYIIRVYTLDGESSVKVVKL